MLGPIAPDSMISTGVVDSFSFNRRGNESQFGKVTLLLDLTTDRYDIPISKLEFPWQLKVFVR